MMSILFRALLPLLICLVCGPVMAQSGQIYDVRLGLQGGSTRLVVEAAGGGTITVVEGPQTIISMPPFQFGGVIPRLKPVYNVTGLDVDGRSGKIVLTFNSPYRLQGRMSLPSSAHPGAQRYVFDFVPVMGQPVVKLEAPKVAITERPVPMTTKLEDVRPQPVRQTPSGPLVVVLDAGHGGKDPGAHARDGTREKDVTLATAKAVRDELRSRGYTAYLTRDTDIFIPLRERVNIARKYKADLFISIHADSVASGNSNAQGASVYTLSNVASDKETAALAARENRADIIGGIDLSHEDKDVADILIDLAMRDTMNQGKKLANTLVAEFETGGLRMRNPAHRSAGFAVLKAADIPSILLEIGYLSNPDEARNLVSRSHQARLASEIADTVADYASRHRPQN